MVRTVTGRGADACRRALEFADGEVERAKQLLLEDALPNEGGSEPVVTRTRSSSVDSRSPQPRAPAKAAAPSPAPAPRPGVGGDDLRTWLG
eukprot:COSAG05_NODE_21526_length_271_cov_0.604651_1_plen_90_part_11